MSTIVPPHHVKTVAHALTPGRTQSPVLVQPVSKEISVKTIPTIVPQTHVSQLRWAARYAWTPACLSSTVLVSTDGLGCSASTNPSAQGSAPLVAVPSLAAVSATTLPNATNILVAQTRRPGCRETIPRAVAAPITNKARQNVKLGKLLL